MTWFRVDDKLHDHKKAMRAGHEAMGLWVLSASWCAGNLTDGFVPDYAATRLVPNAEELADRLVRAGLWHVDELDGDRGWRFHAWSEWQVTREQVEQRRAATRERMRAVRSKGQNVRAHTANTARAVRDVDTDTDTKREDAQARPARKRATQLPSDFRPNETNEKIAAERGLDLPSVLAQFCDHHTAKGSTFKDWHAALNTWLRREQPPLPGTRAAAAQQRAPRVTLAQCPDSDRAHEPHRWEQGPNTHHCQGVQL